MDALNNIRNNQLECSVLGAILRNGELFYRLSENHISEVHFYTTANKELYRIMASLVKDNEVIDIATVSNYIVKNNLSSIVSITYASELLNSIVTTKGFDSCLKELERYREKRAIKDLMTYINENLNEDNEALKDEISKRVIDINTVSSKDNGDLKVGVQKVRDDLEFRLSDNKNKIKGIVSGLRFLDMTLDGFNKGCLITAVARSGIGKSTFATSIILNMLRNKNKIAFFSMEMPVDQIIKKLAFNYCNVNAKDYQTGVMTDYDSVRFMNYLNDIEDEQNLKVYNDSDFNSIISKIKMQKLKSGLDIVFVDYLNRITGVKGNSRDIEFNIITSRLKDIALQEDICIVALTQANRQVDKQTDKRISLADIKESSSIEQNSDQVIALYRNKKLDSEAYQKHLCDKNLLDWSKPNADFNPECIEIEILKNRHGECKKIVCKWEGQYSRVKNWG